MQVVVRPALVQGALAAEDIAPAIRELNQLEDVDVMIVGRGGGSIEDLWAFNEEVVARAIFESRIPVISAVGHEIDFTIADFVADLRAPTPSAAAELVARSRLELEGHLDHLAQRLAGQMQGRLELLDERVRGLVLRLRSPRQQLQLWQQRHADLLRRLGRAMAQRQQEAEGRLSRLSGRLDLLSPLRTLERGYAIAIAERTGRAVLDAGSLSRGDRLLLRFARGRARATVEKVGE